MAAKDQVMSDEQQKALAMANARLRLQQSGGEGIPVQRRTYTGVEALMEAPFNVPGGLLKQAEGLGEAIASPVQTVSGLAKLASGAWLSVMPASIRKNMIASSSDPAAAQQAVDAAEKFGQDYIVGRYGSKENFYRTLAEDPVSILADFSAVVGGGSSALQAANLPRAAAVTSAASRWTNPMTPLIVATKLPFQAGAKGINYLRDVTAPKETALLAAAEGQGPAIINALRNYDQWVAGGQPTAGVAVAGQMPATKYAALQQQLSEGLPTLYYARKAENAAARKAAIGTVAQDEAAMAQAQRARAQVSEPLYEAAATAGNVVDTSGVLSTIDGMLAKQPANTQLVKELRQIRNNLIADKKTGTLRTNSEEVMSAIDDLKGRLNSVDNAHIKGQLKTIREKLVAAVPNYKAAQEAFAQASKPINIMQVGQYLEGKLLPATETSAGERAGVFASAVKEAPTTIKQSTGQARFDKLEQVLEPDQVKIVEGIRKDLAREAEFKAQAFEGGKGGKQYPAVDTVRAPNMMSRIVAVANTILTKLQGKIDKKLAIEMATEMLDPELAAQAMEKALARQARGEKLADPFRKVGRAGAAVLYQTKRPLTLGGVQVSNALAGSNQNNLRND